MKKWPKVCSNHFIKSASNQGRHKIFTKSRMNQILHQISTVLFLLKFDKTYNNKKLVIGDVFFHQKWLKQIFRISLNF